MRLAPALLPPLLDLDPDEAFFAGVADDTDQSSAARSLREVFRQAATLGLDGSSLGKCLCSYGLGEAAAAAIAAAWSAQRSGGGARALVQPPALRLVDMDWSFGVSASSSEHTAMGSTFVALRLRTEQRTVHMELSLEAFYDLLHELQAASTQLDAA